MLKKISIGVFALFSIVCAVYFYGYMTYSYKVICRDFDCEYLNEYGHTEIDSMTVTPEGVIHKCVSNVSLTRLQRRDLLMKGCLVQRIN